MKLKNSIVFLAMVSMLLLFVACDSENDGTTPNFAPYVGGTEGITFNFMQGMPSDVPGAILDNGKSQFSIGVKVTNVGEHDILSDSENDYFMMNIKGIPYNVYGLDSADDLRIPLEDDLLGASKNFDGTTLNGDFTIMSLEDLSYTSDIQGDLPINFLVDLCYDYSTNTQTRICIADDVYEALRAEGGDLICDVTATQPTMNSGAPVHVKNLKQTPMGGSMINVFFDIIKVGQGDVYLYESTEDCDPSSSNGDKNEVMVEISLPTESNAVLECNGFEKEVDVWKKTVTLADGMSQVSCKIGTGQDGDNTYMETLKVDLYYRYNDQIRKSLVVKDTGNAYD